ncbi:MAG: hypothetical protein ACLT8E_06935 [Akkermansia sp.]
MGDAGEGVDNGWIGGHTSGDLYGDIHLRLEGPLANPRYSALLTGTVHGDIYLNFSSTGTYDTSFTNGEKRTAPPWRDPMPPP